MEEERIPEVLRVNKHVYYGTCSTAANEDEKEIVVQNPTLYVDGDNKYLDLNEGDQLIISFSERNSVDNPQFILYIKEAGSDELINIGTYIDSGRIVIDGQTGISLINYWESGSIITCTYVVNINSNTGYWVINNYGPASENRYGTVKLADSEDENIDETDENTAASIPRIQNMIDDNISQGLSLAWGNTWGDLVLQYKGEELHTDGSLDGVSVPTSTAQLINEGPKDVIGNNRYIYKTDSTIDESASTLNIGNISSQAINTNNKTITSGAITCGTINTQNNNINTGTGTITSGAITSSGNITGRAIAGTSLNVANGTITSGTITCGTINTQNNNISAGTGTITAGTIGAYATSIVYGKSAAFASLNTSANINTIGSTGYTTLNAKAINIGSQTLAQYIDARLPQIRSFYVTSYSCGVQLNAKSQMVEVKTPGVKVSDYSAYIPIGVTGWTPLGVIGVALGKYGNNTLATLPVFQDYYVSGSNVYFHVQTAGNTAGWVLVQFWILYYK